MRYIIPFLTLILSLTGCSLVASRKDRPLSQTPSPEELNSRDMGITRAMSWECGGSGWSVVINHSVFGDDGMITYTVNGESNRFDVSQSGKYMQKIYEMPQVFRNTVGGRHESVEVNIPLIRIKDVMNIDDERNISCRIVDYGDGVKLASWMYIENQKWVFDAWVYPSGKRYATHQEASRALDQERQSITDRSKLIQQRLKQRKAIDPFATR